MAFGGMKEWMLLFEGLVLVFIAGSFSHQVAGARTLITGEPCVIPFSFNVSEDCHVWNGVHHSMFGYVACAVWGSVCGGG